MNRLAKQILTLIATAFLAFAFFSSQESPKPQTPKVVQEPLITLVNRERAKVGVPLLAEDPKLNFAAQAKAQNMADLNYKAHRPPTGEDTFTSLRVQYPYFEKVGENLAWCHITNAEKVNWWIHSSGHYSTMIDPIYEGFGWGEAYNEEDDCIYTVTYYINYK